MTIYDVWAVTEKCVFIETSMHNVRKKRYIFFFYRDPRVVQAFRLSSLQSKYVNVTPMNDHSHRSKGEWANFLSNVAGHFPTEDGQYISIWIGRWPCVSSGCPLRARVCSCLRCASAETARVCDAGGQQPIARDTCAAELRSYMRRSAAITLDLKAL